MKQQFADPSYLNICNTQPDWKRNFQSGIKKDIENSLKEIAKEYNVNISIGNFNETITSLKLGLTIKATENRNTDFEYLMDEQLKLEFKGTPFGGQKTYIGKLIKISPNQTSQFMLKSLYEVAWKIVAYDWTQRNFPIVLKQESPIKIKNNKSLHITKEDVKEFL